MWILGIIVKYQVLFITKEHTQKRKKKQKGQYV